MGFFPINPTGVDMISIGIQISKGQKILSKSFLEAQDQVEEYGEETTERGTETAQASNPLRDKDVGISANTLNKEWWETKADSLWHVTCDFLVTQRLDLF